MSIKKKIFILTDWFVPGYKAGGPITSVYSMCNLLAETHDVYVLTNNHDWHEEQSYDLPSDEWLLNGKFKVRYAAKMSLIKTISLIHDLNPDYVYLNGIYSPQFHALPLLWHLLRGRKGDSFRWIVAPRGMLNPNAIALKSFKKKRLIKAYEFLGIKSKVSFHATSKEEEQAVKRIWRDARVHVLSNLPSVPFESLDDVGISLRSGFISVGRISPVKNTLKLIELFSAMNLSLTIIGTHDDEEYFAQCLRVVGKSNKVKIIPGLAPDLLVKEVQQHKFFVSMTTGENFGHAIVEALALGCPVIIPDTTPWNDVHTAEAGWVVPLEDSAAWENCIMQAEQMDDADYNVYRSNARNYVKAKFDLVQIKNAYLNLFND